ncbi:MAG: hypothetical protein PHT62_08800 [Desulfotomaculaceae bacterium]|nr:hypothetical protein [Desulfotomaculaceae bacterium]
MVHKKQPMVLEFETDEQVLSILESTEYKDYDRALLAVLEGFATQRLPLSCSAWWITRRIPSGG